MFSPLARKLSGLAVTVFLLTFVSCNQEQLRVIKDRIEAVQEGMAKEETHENIQTMIDGFAGSGNKIAASLAAIDQGMDLLKWLLFGKVALDGGGVVVAAKNGKKKKKGAK